MNHFWLIKFYSAACWLHCWFAKLPNRSEYAIVFRHKTSFSIMLGLSSPPSPQPSSGLPTTLSTVRLHPGARDFGRGAPGWVGDASTPSPSYLPPHLAAAERYFSFMKLNFYATTARLAAFRRWRRCRFAFIPPQVVARPKKKATNAVVGKNRDYVDVQLFPVRCMAVTIPAVSSVFANGGGDPTSRIKENSR
uniref:Putative secreted protein n=1 Tax=Anopheles triannulatus TaxID=58253 RepID=A0A2M4B1T1_9DIPT